MPHNERCGKPDSIGDKRRKKKPACSVIKQAGVPIDRVIERANFDRPCMVDAILQCGCERGVCFYKIYRTNLTEIHVGDGTVLYSPSIGYWAIPF